MSHHEPISFCEATFCSRRTDGRFMCDLHWELLDSDQKARVPAIEHRGIFARSLSDSVVAQIEVLAQAVETVDARAGINDPPPNQYRVRLNQLQRAREAAQEPAGAGAGPTVQGRLLEENPAYAGPYGPGRDHGRS